MALATAAGGDVSQRRGGTFRPHGCESECLVARCMVGEAGLSGRPGEGSRASPSAKGGGELRTGVALMWEAAANSALAPSGLARPLAVMSGSGARR